MRIEWVIGIHAADINRTYEPPGEMASSNVIIPQNRFYCLPVLCRPSQMLAPRASMERKYGMDGIVVSWNRSQPLPSATILI